MARIPMASDVAELIGSAAEKVENRSLLLDKFIFHKRWPLEADAQGREAKRDDASRWSFMRIAGQVHLPQALAAGGRCPGPGGEAGRCFTLEFHAHCWTSSSSTSAGRWRPMPRAGRRSGTMLHAGVSCALLDKFIFHKRWPLEAD